MASAGPSDVLSEDVISCCDVTEEHNHREYQDVRNFQGIVFNCQYSTHQRNLICDVLVIF